MPRGAARKRYPPCGGWESLSFRAGRSQNSPPVRSDLGTGTGYERPTRHLDTRCHFAGRQASAATGLNGFISMVQNFSLTLATFELTACRVGMLAIGTV